MEVGRGSACSNNELPERRRKKKTSSLPLAAFLSFNDRDVHPGCPNANNSYHKCGRHCFDKIPSSKSLMGALRLEGDQGWERKSDKSGIYLNCPNASNPYHKCAEYCFQNLPPMRQDAGKDQPVMKPKEEKRAGFATDRVARPDCKNASNPYHVCDEYCLENVPVKGKPVQVIRLKSLREVKKLLSIKERTSSSPHLCKYASNPYHDCNVLCCQNMPAKNLAEGVIKHNEEKKASFTTERVAKSGCKNSSNLYYLCDEQSLQNVHVKDQRMKVMQLQRLNKVKSFLSSKERTDSPPPYSSNGGSTKIDKSTARRSLERAPISHKVNEHYIESTHRNDHHMRAINSKEESDKVLTIKQRVKLECKNESNSEHLSADYCFQNASEKERLGQPANINKSKEDEKELNNKGTTYLDPKYKYASNPHHDCTTYCYQNVPERTITVEAVDNLRGFTADRTNELKNPMHLSNHDHEVIKYCFGDDLKKKQPEGVLKLNEESKIAVTEEKHVAKSECKNEHAIRKKSSKGGEKEHLGFEDVPRSKLTEGTFMKSKEDSKVVAPLEKKLNSQCKNASSRDHVCTEYCFQNAPDGNLIGQALTNSKEEKKAVYSPQRVNSECKNASNPYHICAEYCVENDQRGKSTMKSKPKERAVLPAEVVNPDCKFASNPYHVCAEYCFQNFTGREQHKQVSKLQSLKELNKLVSRKKMTSGNPPCKFVSNPYHECSEYCQTKMVADNNIPNRDEINNSQKRDDNLKCKHVSNPSHKFAENGPEEIKRSSLNENKRNRRIRKSHSSKNVDSRKISLHEGTEVDAPNASSNIFDLSDGANDLNSAKWTEMRNHNPSLYIDGSELFQEWEKYCSQKKLDDDRKIVVQEKTVGLGELPTRHNRINTLIRDNGATILGKVQSTWRTPSSLFNSFHFFLGFLSAMVHWTVWTQVIHSVMSSEKNKGSASMKLEGDMDCNRSEFGFRGLDEGMR